ncbi:neutrophil collagenase isoform 1 preproprotein [Homo sapiens]|uniref:Neutrophil collagenase n=1 Tax=Homo sapiens TaxID=9606 RepID=MMP8_HUMAN|nr:neutrophil collagenase isoform 1 preproprotein [Homo sapiens]P22894.1 RecName: Full=Neutrophil collagenase; AltName: Full=Matrix metalloproteinase-8; Short=MMP-8; AltName: Full=PMNL collagenase; Short=PMNL-CL; Flags: Precursor [Homo sapiens]AAA88021.1 neutrophil collagenase [Homo sapiens]AAH74988.1 Matrix metallopeptidase 8 (neutrophil collagenase) [Homo sapiens]AAH74989.1 Matrix metallopeptidase 8 (neutrophil collagenase) [Homo sapiens]|eukprot:NP_002415.1 neutrophil collagenase isoform 1 preproprotein [Homo sapiens]
MFSLKTLPFLLLLHVQISKAFPVSSKEKNTKTVQDYLEKFYQLPSNQYQSTRKNGTNVIVEKLKEMQRFFGLNVTGKPNEETLDMMKKPRCGVPDSGGFMLTPGNPKWERTNLTYRIRNYTPQLSEAEVERAIKDAFELWSVASPLIFTRISQGEADINIAFYQRDHGDNSPFDGPNGILAHAFQPGQGIGGDAHFDAEETWTNTSANYNLFLVAAHEFGHSLGLAHSSDPGALMYPNYAFRETSNYSLPQDDIDGIQAIYGLSSNPIQPTGPSTPKPCDPSLTFDAITTLRGEILFFKDRYFWRRHPQLQRVEMNFISLFWPSLPTGIQAAYEDFDRDLIFLFKGNQYWALSGYDILQGYPKDISNYGFPSSVQAIDAAVFYRSKTYFFVNDQFWRYDNQRQFMEPGYPKSISGAFPGIESKVDAVFQQEHFFHVFSGPRYYAFDLIAQRVTRVARGNKWLNCRYG